MDTLQHLMAGLTAALSLQNLAFALIGCVLGTLIGVLPGPRAGRRHRDPDPADLQARPDRRPHHAVAPSTTAPCTAAPSPRC